MTEPRDIPMPEHYQALGIEFLAARRHAILGDEMRLGKTPQAILAADQLASQTIIVVTVAVGVFNWEAQFKRWSIHDRQIHAVTEGKQPTPQSGVIILSFDMAKKHGPKLPRADLLIVDECHFIKSVDAGRAAAVVGKDGLIHRARRAWFLSGTPSPNGDPREMWTILYTCGATKLTYDEFQARYCEGWMGPYGFNVRGVKNADELRDLLKPFMLRRRWKDVKSELPELTFESLVVPAGPVDIELWFPDWWLRDQGESLKSELVKERAALTAVQEVTAAAHANARAFTSGLENLAPALCTLRRYTALQKCPAIVEMVKDELERGVYEKLVIFCVHRDPIEYLRRELSKYKAVTLYGGTSTEARRRNMEKFHNNPKCRVFIGQIQASGTNVDLSCASDIMFLEQDWVPGNNAQAAMRCHNIKQRKNVHVRIAGLANDVDEKVQSTLHRKLRDLTQIYDN